MMKKILFAITLFAVVSFAACTASPPPTTSMPTVTSAVNEDTEIRAVVETFGKRLQTVSLLAPDAAQELQQQYTELVSPTLLETWVTDPSKAPGRLVSSPWPDRIEITNLSQEAPDQYTINGYIVEVTSTEVTSGGAANKIPVLLTVEKDQGHWLITEFTEEG